MRYVLPLLLLLLIVVAGCDSAAGGNVFLSPRDVTFEFQVDGGNVTVGQQATANSTGSASLQGNLDGFSLDELVAARVTAVRLRRVSPLSDNLGGLLQSAQVAVTSGSTQQVASGSGFGSVTQVNLTTTGADVTAILRQPQFTGRLTFVPAKAVDATYEVTLTLALEVEGL